MKVKSRASRIVSASMLMLLPPEGNVVFAPSSGAYP
jgi:hypothetical protein